MAVYSSLGRFPASVPAWRAAWPFLYEPVFEFKSISTENVDLRNEFENVNLNVLSLFLANVH